jgi:hypothetical protein
MATTTTTVARRPTLAEKNKQLRETLEIVENNHQLVSESLKNAVAMLRQEDVGWAMPGDDGTYRGLNLQALKKWSDQIRASLSGTENNAPNPHMRNGLMLRHSFIWDGDMHYADVPGDKENAPTRGKTNVQEKIDAVDNQRLFFSPTARRRREGALFSDGLYLAVGDNSTKKIRSIPLHEITATQRDEFYEDDIVAYRWTRNEAVRNRYGVLTGERKAVSRWVFVDWYDGKKPDDVRFGPTGELEEVMKGHTAFDLHANRPDGAAFGSPDAISALVWARIIRDLIMNGVKMQDALAMFAFKATSPSKLGQQTAALELAKPTQAGSAATLAGDNDLVPLNSAGKGYDFGSIGFVVATMAASLHVSGIALSANTALAGSSYGAAKTLDLPGRMAMETRRAEHVEFDKRVLRWMGAPDATVYFDNYDDATDEYRSVQAAMLMWSSGNLSPEGFREELEIIYGRKLMGSIPKGVITPNNQKAIDDAAAATEKAAAAAAAAAAKPDEQTPSTPAPNQGKSDGTGGAGHANDIKVKAK